MLRILTMKLFLILTILLISANWSHAETLNQLRNRCNTFLTNKVPILVARQNTYASNHGGRFFQGLITHSSIPAHTTSTAGDAPGNRLTFRPTDQIESWADILPEFNSENFAAAATIDVYNGPSGNGWFLTVWVRHNGVIYQRQKWWGPENHDYDWRIWDPAQ